MSDERQIQVLDISEQEAIGAAIVLMIQQSPFVTDRIKVRFEDMGDNMIGVFAQQGTVYLARYLSGAFRAQYAFFLRYRVRPATDERRLAEQERLEALAKWLEGQTVTYGGTEYKLSAYPELADNRTIETIVRTSGAFTAQMADDGTVDYQVYLQLRYMKGATT